ncbi:uncharacterized protein EI90DRAFT_3036657, partial [Cantharellus anzutake]|uniref:uncharacterized protein n=1 Tax=Cantharellus anzutake TaxID=1750568 RepID=UPI0019052C5D
MEDSTHTTDPQHSSEAEHQERSDSENEEMWMEDPTPEDEEHNRNWKLLEEASTSMNEVTERLSLVGLAGLWEQLLPTYSHWFAGLPKATYKSHGEKMVGKDLESRLAEAEANVSNLASTNAYLSNCLKSLESKVSTAQTQPLPERDPDTVAKPMVAPTESWASVAAKNPPKPQPRQATAKKQIVKPPDQAHETATQGTEHKQMAD